MLIITNTSSTMYLPFKVTCEGCKKFRITLRHHTVRTMRGGSSSAYSAYTTFPLTTCASKLRN